MKQELARREKDGVSWYVFRRIERFDFISHWITTRHGGSAQYGFDLARNGADAGIADNRRKAEELFADGERIYLPAQVHGTRVCEPSADACEADAVLALRPGESAGVLTADCFPVILVDQLQKTGAIIHAGRKGVFGGILKKTAERMGGRPRDIVAAIGPGIRPCCYEVKEDVFAGGFEAFKGYWLDGKIDLVSALKVQMMEMNIPPQNILDSGVCTSCRVDEFYSHRAENGKTGRFMTGIRLTNR